MSISTKGDGKQMTPTYCNNLDNFLRRDCPLPGNWCNGDIIPRPGRKHLHHKANDEQEPCQYYTGKGCIHPKCPKKGENHD